MRHPFSFRPVVETLESRLTPANVSGSVVKGVLTLVADDPNADDGLSITSHASIPAAVVVTASGSTTVNTGADDTFKKVRSIVVKLKGGDDVLAVFGLRLGGNLTFHGGSSAIDGNDFNMSSSMIGGTVTINNGHNGAGLDEVTMVGNIQIGRHVIINHGTGASNTNIASGSPDVFVGGNVSVTGSGPFLDVVTISNTSVGGKVTAALAGGQNLLALNFGVVHKSVLFQGGGGNDNLSLTSEAINGSVTARLGNGDNQVDFDAVGGFVSTVGSRISGAVSITAGSGTDTIIMGEERPVVIGGPVSIATGDEASGGDSVTFEDTFFLGKVLVDLGAGDDTLEFDVLGSDVNQNTSIGGKLTVLGRAGDDHVSFGDSSLAELALHLAVQPTLKGGGGSNTLFASQYTIDGVAQEVLSDVVGFAVQI